MDVYTGPMCSVITKLLNHLEEESVLPSEVKDCLLSMTRELWKLQFWFRSWSNTPPDKLGEDERFWLSQLREVFYEAKILVDYLAVTAESTEHVANLDGTQRLRITWDSWNPPVCIAYIKQITARAREVLARLRLPLPGLHMYEEQTELVGIESQKDEFMKILAEEDDPSKKQMKIFCLVGIGGSGKTALAQAVYNQLKPQFECGAFVTVSLQHSMEGFFTEMLHQLQMENHTKNEETELLSPPFGNNTWNKRFLQKNEEANDEKQLICQIQNFLHNKRYLIVIDDLRDQEYWHRISCCLPNNDDCGSRVIATTRNSDVARSHSSSYKSTYQIQHLGYVDSKKLFLQHFFGDNVSCPLATDDFNEILKMCGGTPSAVISIALLLSTKVTTKKAWQEVTHFVYSAWKQAGTMQVDVPGLEDLRSIIFLTYVHLPGTLRDCLLYLAVHGKSRRIHKTTVVRKWIAEGFIHEYVRFSRKEVASRYFDELINMNFIQLVKYGDYIGKEIYEVNYMVLYVLRLISQVEYFATFLSDVGISMQYADSVRLSIRCSGSELSVHTEKMDPFRIRSITIIGPAKFYLTNNLVYLRLLDLDGCKDLNNSAMDYICRMLLLKYLSLKHTQVTEIPPEIGELRCLETLDIRKTHVSYLPPEIGLLRNLETLVIRQTQVSCIPPEIKLLQNLETLDIRQTQVSCIPPEIGMLHNLETLVIRQTQVNCLPAEIGLLQNLETLDIRQTQVKELSKELFELPKLAHLYYGQNSSLRGVKLPMGSDQWDSVKVLDTIDSREWSGSAMEEISELTGVRELEVVLHDQPVDKNQNDKFLSSIGKCKNLENLIIYGDYNPSEDVIPSSAYFPLLERLRVAGRFVKVPQWISLHNTLKKIDISVCKLEQDDLKILGGLPRLNTLALALICIPWKKEVAITNWLKSSTSTVQSPTEETSPAGFMSLKIFSFDSRVPWITFEQETMPSLKDLHLKLYACPSDKFPSGLVNLGSLEKIILQYRSEYASSSGVTKVVAAMREEASSHRNLICLSVNGYNEVFLPNTSVDKTINGSENEEDSNHGNQIELSGNGDHEVDTKVDETIAGTETEGASFHGNIIELPVHEDHEVFDTRVNETITGTETEEASIHGNLNELSANGDHEVLDTRVDKTITATEAEDASNHGNPIELSVDGDHEVLLPNTRIDETITGTEIKECY